MIIPFFTPFREEIRVQNISLYRVLSRDVTAAILPFLNERNGGQLLAVPHLVSPPTPPGIELGSYANACLSFWLKSTLIDYVSENTLLR